MLTSSHCGNLSTSHHVINALRTVAFLRVSEVEVSEYGEWRTYTAQSLSTSTILQQFSSTGTQTAQQVLLVKKVGAAPAEGQILVPIDKKHKLWIPGYMLGNGGTVQFKEKDTNGYERDALYGHVLMFQTLSNYKTWEYTTGVTGSTATYLGKMTDFLQVTYFKDF